MNCNNILSYFVISLKTELLFTKNTKILKIVLKFLYREAPLRGPTPYPSLNHFSRKRYPFVYLLLTNGSLLTAVNAL